MVVYCLITVCLKTWTIKATIISPWLPPTEVLCTATSVSRIKYQKEKKVYYYFLCLLHFYISCVIFHTPKVAHYFEFGLENSTGCVVHLVTELNMTERLSLSLWDYNTVLTGIHFSFSFSFFFFLRHVCLWWKHKYYSWAPALQLVPCYVSHLQLIDIWFVDKLSVLQPCSNEHSRAYQLTVLCRL